MEQQPHLSSVPIIPVFEDLEGEQEQSLELAGTYFDSASLVNNPMGVVRELNTDLAAGFLYSLRHAIQIPEVADSIYGPPTGVFLRSGNVLVYSCPALSQAQRSAGACRMLTRLFFQMVSEMALVTEDSESGYGYPIGITTSSLSEAPVDQVGAVESDFVLVQLNPYLFGLFNILDQVPMFKPLVDRLSLANLNTLYPKFTIQYPKVAQEILKLQKVDQKTARQHIKWVEFWR